MSESDTMGPCQFLSEFCWRRGHTDKVQPRPPSPLTLTTPSSVTHQIASVHMKVTSRMLITPTLLVGLLLSPGNLFSIPLTRAQAINVPRQDHERNHYYAMHLRPDINPKEIATALGIIYEGCLGELEDHYLFSMSRTDEDGHLLDPLGHRLKKRSFDDEKRDNIQHGILYMERQRTKRHHKRYYIPRLPDDIPPLVSETARDLQISDPLFPVQWHLLNPIQLGHDVNVTGVWREGHFGENVTVAIVDDGLDMDSLDLKDNYFAAGSYDFNDHVLVPKPKLRDDQHGTRCAGEIAAVRNDVCGVGVAYKSRVAGIRILSAEISDADEAVALNYAWQDNHIYSCSWGPPDDGKSMDAPGLLIKRAFVNGINKGRGGLGSVYVFASGNGGAQQDNCNFDGYTNSIYSITVGAVDRMGQHPYYSELCSAQLVVTYSSGSGSFIHTTDVGASKCTDRHGGTSAAAPLAAGIFALALGVRPDLNWRDLQQLCVDTAQIVDESDPDWETVTNGRKFNHKYGFGKLDAYKLVEAAKTFKHLKPQAWHHTKEIVVKKNIPDDNVEGLTSVVEIFPKDLKASNLEVVEHVQVWMNLTHQRRGDVVIDLISPRGVVSHICTKRKFDVSGEGMAGWYFMSVKHWYTRTAALANDRGETGIGNWTVKVSDAENGSTGKWQSWQLILWGSSIDPALAKPHPLPGSKDDPSLTPIEALPNPTVSPPLESEPASPSPSSTTAPSSGFWPWSAERKWLWIYGSIAVITLFVSVVGVWYCRQRQKARLLQTHGEGREDYEFEVLLNEGGEGVSQRRAGELYDAFAGGEEYLPNEMAGKGRRRSGEDIDDREMGGFLADSEEDEEDEDVEDEKGIQKLLKGKR